MITITEKQYNEKMNRYTVPEITDEKLVGKKALLGNQDAENIFVPYGVLEIGDWAFAHCTKLREIWLPDTIKKIGRDVFLDDDKLERIFIYSEEYAREEVAELLAVAVKCFKKCDLLSVADSINRFDESLTDYINESDDAGFDPFLAGGEEDYEDPENDIEFYKKKQRMKKCGAIFVRLKFQDETKEEGNNQAVFENYLKANKDDAVQFILDKKTDSYNYLKLYAGHGFIEESDISGLLDKFADEDYIECKAYLMKYKEENFGSRDIWDSFKL